MARRVNEFLLGQMDRYRVTAVAVVCKMIDGTEAYLYEGAWLPLGASPAHIEYLLELGVIEKVGS